MTTPTGMLLSRAILTILCGLLARGAYAADSCFDCFDSHLPGAAPVITVTPATASAPRCCETDTTDAAVWASRIGAQVHIVDKDYLRKQVRRPHPTQPGCQVYSVEYYNDISDPHWTTTWSWQGAAINLDLPGTYVLKAMLVNNPDPKTIVGCVDDFESLPNLRATTPDPTQTRTITIQVLDATPELKSVSFSGGVQVRPDPGDPNTPGYPDYLDPHWSRDNISLGYHPSPIAYVRNNKITAQVTVYIAGKFCDPLKIKGTATNPNLNFPATTAQVVASDDQGSTITATIQSAGNLPGTILYKQDFQIEWEVLYGTGECPTSAGTSSNELYVLLATPLLPASRLYHTVIHIGCEKGSGRSTADKALADAIFTEFADLTVEDRNGDALFYYKERSQTPPYFSTEELLAHNDARCGAWARFFRDILLAQGIHSGLKMIVVDHSAPDQCGFGVKNWQTVLPFQELPGVPGQGPTPDPWAAFEDHAVVEFAGHIYDPSYGSTFSSLNDWEDSSIDLFFYPGSPPVPNDPNVLQVVMYNQ
ncbi:MAG: hypothetical protein KF858_03725 [Candidatus Sumerlaeia bacterium]|nr:hypothetical protein [Candidatus Sumerlaeia bacterium]